MSRYMWLTLLRSKADAPAAIMTFQARVERETGKKLKVLRTDNGGEFTSVEFGEYCVGEGVPIRATAERRGGTSKPDGRGDGEEHPAHAGHAGLLLG